MPINFVRARIAKLLIKPPAAFQDDATHYLKIHICELERNHKDVTSGAPRPYVFVLPIAGCENGYTTWNNCQTGCWDYSNSSLGGKRNEINFTICVTIDDQEVAFEPELLLELEFE